MHHRALDGRQFAEPTASARSLLISGLCALTLLVSVGLAPAATVPAFTRITGAAGLDGSYSAPGIYGPGVAVFDLEGDGDLDLFVPNDLSGHKLYRNEGNDTFVDVAPELGLNFVTELPPLEDRTHPFELDPTAMMPVFLDTDNDGDKDFFLTCWNSYNRFFENVNGEFVDRTAESGLGIVGRSATAAWGDYNRDGLLDVYIADWGGYDRLFRNDGDNSWTNTSDRMEIYEGLVQPQQPGWSAIWFDHDGDLSPELYVGNDFGLPNFFYRNEGSNLREAARDHFPELLDPNRTLHDGNATMGQALGDFDRDGDYDLFVANSLVNDLYRREGDVYLDMMEDPLMVGPGGPMRNLKNNDIGWHCGWPDIDNDGWVDLFLVNGYIRLCLYDDPLNPDCSGQGQRAQNNCLWMNNGDDSFDFVTDVAGLSDLAWGKSGALADFDGDGDLDIFVSNSGSTVEPSQHALWRNDTPSTEQGNWLVVTLEGTTSNRDGYGAKVRATAAGVTHMRDHVSSSGYLAQAPPEVHFGLGDADAVERLRVIWPSGTVDVWRDVSVNTRIHLVEGASESVPALVAPRLVAGSREHGVELTWDVGSGDDWDHFRVMRSAGGSWLGTLAQVEAISERSEYRWVDASVMAGESYTYRIDAVRADGSISSEPVTVQVSGVSPRLVVSPARPNPFNPRTTLQFRVPANTRSLQLRIIDAMGRSVKQFAPEFDAGWHSLIWEGDDGRGRPVASGSYRFVVEADGRSESTPLTLVR